MRVLVVHYDGSLKPLGTLFVDRLLSRIMDLSPYAAAAISLDNLSAAAAPELVVLCHVSRQHDWQLYQKIRQAWGNRVFVVTITEEPFDLFHSLADWSFSFKPSAKTGDYINPGLIQYSACIKALMDIQAEQLGDYCPADFEPLFTSAYGRSLGETYQFIRQCRGTTKDRFCNFIYRNNSTIKCPGVRRRNRICRQLMKYKRVDCAGRTMNNTAELYQLQQEQTRDVDKLKYMSLGFMAKYKFTIAGENRFYPFYISEKILFPLLVGSIPIYAGTEKVSQLINPKCFINASDYNSYEELVAKVAEIDQNPQLYAEYINAPVFLADSLIYDLSAKGLETKLAPLIAAIKRQQELVTTGPKQPKLGTSRRTNKVLSYLEYKIRKTLAKNLSGS